MPRPPNEPKDAVNGSALDCLSQFKLGYYFVVQSIHHRRYPLVDNERGVVWSHAVFDQGTVNEGVLSDGRKYAFKGFNRPSSILVTEAFLIENGKIRRVEMIGPSATVSHEFCVGQRVERKLSAADQNSGSKDKRATETHLNRRGERRRIHKVVANPGDRGEFQQNNDDRGGHGDVKIRN